MNGECFTSTDTSEATAIPLVPCCWGGWVRLMLPSWICWFRLALAPLWGALSTGTGIWLASWGIWSRGTEGQNASGTGLKGGNCGIVGGWGVMEFWAAADVTCGNIWLAWTGSELFEIVWSTVWCWLVKDAWKINSDPCEQCDINSLNKFKLKWWMSLHNLQYYTPDWQNSYLDAPTYNLVYLTCGGGACKVGGAPTDMEAEFEKRWRLWLLWCWVMVFTVGCWYWWTVAPGAAKDGTGHCVGVGDVEDKCGYWVRTELSICEHGTGEMSGYVETGKLVDGKSGVRDDCMEEGKEAG